jgi:hypothetical protein
VARSRAYVRRQRRVDASYCPCMPVLMLARIRWSVPAPCMLQPAGPWHHTSRHVAAPMFSGNGKFLLLCLSPLLRCDHAGTCRAALRDETRRESSAANPAGQPPLATTIQTKVYHNWRPLPMCISISSHECQPNVEICCQSLAFMAGGRYCMGRRNPRLSFFPENEKWRPVRASPCSQKQMYLLCPDMQWYNLQPRSFKLLMMANSLIWRHQSLRI